jgi:predicted metal-dependent peptidase
MIKGGPCPTDVSTEKWIAKAKIKMMISAPFHGSVVSQTEFRERSNIQTAATDGTTIFYNADFVREQSLPKLCWLLAHEAEHIMMLHCFRMGKRDPTKWNYACDYSINSTTLESLVQQGVFERIEVALYDEKYVNWSSEKIYEAVPDSEVPEEQPGSHHVIAPGSDPADGEGSGGEEGVEGQPRKFLSEGDIKELEEQAKRKVLAAAETAKSMGSLPGEYSSLLDKIRHPTVDWKELLQRAVVGETPDDYTMRRPNRKLIQSGFYMPSILKQSVGNIYVWRDTSASMSDEDDRKVCSELRGIVEDVKPQAVYVIDCDTSVNSVKIFYPGDNLDSLERVGYGGTDPHVFFDWVEENAEEVQAIICLTDMCFDLDERKLPSIAPVTWVSTIDRDPNNGNFIYLPSGED